MKKIKIVLSCLLLVAMLVSIVPVGLTAFASEATAAPSSEPVAEMSAEPTTEPTAVPTVEPTVAPTAEPTVAPTTEPTVAPTTEPTVTPTAAPSATPTAAAKQPVAVTFDCTSKELTLSVYSGDTLQTPDENGVYNLPAAEYTYSAKCDGYVEKNAQPFTVAAQPLTVTITLDPLMPSKMPPLMGAPAQEISVGTAEELKTAINTTITDAGSVKLTADITLAETIVIPTGKTITLDMAGFALSGALDPLFSVTGGSLLVTTSAAVKNITSSTGAAIKVSGGSLTADSVSVTGVTNAVYIDSGSFTANSGTYSGAPAIAVAEAAADAAVNVTIAGGTFDVASGYSLSQSTGVSGSTAANTNISVSGGTFNAPVYSANHRVAFTAGNSATVPAISPSYSVDTATSTASATVDGGLIHGGITNNITCSEVVKTYNTTIPSSGLAAAASNGGTLTISTASNGSIIFDNAALSAINAANTAGADVKLTVSDTTTETGTKQFTLSLFAGSTDIGSAGFGSGTVTVVLNLGSIVPKEIVHTKGSGATETYYLTKPTTDTTAKLFTYNSSAKTVTLSLSSFSTITAKSTSTVAPTITSTDASVTTPVQNVAYSHTLTATGTAPITWAATGIPTGLSLSSAGVLSGTPTVNGSQSMIVTATNDYGSDTKTITIQIQPATMVAELVSGVTKTYYTSAQAAIDTAIAGDTVNLLQAVTENLTINKGITFNADGKTTGTITATAGTSTLNNVNTTSVRAKPGTTVTLAGTSKVTNVYSEGVGTGTGTNATVAITGGEYTALSAVDGGKFAVSGGSFVNEIPLDYCLRNEATTPYTQYHPVYNASTQRWGVAILVPKITKVNNSGYFVMRSSNTLSFTTNVPYALVAKGDIAADSGVQITALTGLSYSRTLASKYYTLSQDTDGNTVLTLNNSYLRTLTERRYSIDVLTKEGTASSSFYVSTVGKTGDSSNIGLWAGIAGGSVLILCVAAVFVVKKGKKK